MSTFSVLFDVQPSLAVTAVDLLTKAGFATSIGASRPDTEGTLVVVECWFDHQREIRLAIDRATSVLTHSGIVADTIRSLPSRGTRRRILKDGAVIPDAYVFGSNDEEWQRNLDVIAADQGVERHRLSLDPEDDPFQELYGGE